ncbi:FAD-binding oxidoreductase [Rhizobium pusense]|uniref:NAD(P)/FAD-dependent oxidoreductase n=1 Tax=Agrobacterium pusense TaxID=648995 RepID=UPI000DDB75CE|nr:FAD-binding oxidoreductase [Agrobacterium pusense]MCJ2877483.1 FAD-binding oxidoreductase [Agrobacterium pusense]
MPIDVDKVHDTKSFPAQVDVVVVGAGIVGASTAYELARKNLCVALVEKGVVGGEQSSRNWGWVRQQNRDLLELPLAVYSSRRWEELGPEMRADLGFRREGSLFASIDKDEIAQWERWSSAAREHGFVNEFLTARQLADRLPANKSKWVGGIWSASDAKAEPSMAAPAIVEGAKALGVHVHQNCAARGLEVVNGKVKGVWTERGLIRSDAVVVAGGAWSSRLCRRHSVDIPVANVEGTAFRTTKAPDVIAVGCLNAGSYSMRRRLDGGYTLSVPGRGTINLAPQNIRYASKFYQMFQAKLSKKLKYRLNSSFWNGPDAWGSWELDGRSPFEKIRIMDPAPEQDLIELALQRVVADFPELEGLKAEAAWGGLIDTSPDLIPVISRCAALDGLVIATGFSGHGFGVGPGAGRLASELVCNETPFIDATAYRLERFSDGSAIKRPEMM